MTNKLVYILIIGHWLAILQGFSQKAPLKWGKVSADELKWKPLGDAKQVAYLLFDYGTLTFADRNDISLTRHLRIKFNVKPEAGSFVFNIPVNHLAGDELSKIKAQVLTPNSSEKYDVVGLKKEDLLIEGEKGKPNGAMLMFTNLAEGSIVELQYVMNSSNPRIPKKWDFQSEMPVMHSEIRMTGSELVKIDVFYRGLILPNKYGRQATDQWILNDLKPIAEEPFSPHPSEYIEQAIFQVAGFYKKAPTYGLDRQMDFYSNEVPWDILAVDLLKSDLFSSYLDNETGLNAADLIITLSDLSDREKVNAVFNHLVQNYQWNSYHAMYPDVELSALLLSKTGNGTALNLLLVALLREAGMEASPVLVSTFDHGSVQKAYPDLSQFNDVITSVRLYGKDQLIDVADAFTPYTMLPMHDINGEGYLMDLSDSRWVKLKTEKSKKSFTNVELTFNDAVQQMIRVRSQYNDYGASEMRQKVANCEDYEAFAESYLIKTDKGLMLDSIWFSELKVLDKPLKVGADYRSETGFQDTIELRPVMIPVFRENPFVAEKRTLPLDFIVPVEDNLTTVINVPEGYVITFIPAPYELSLPGKKGSFTYQVTVTDGRIKINSKVRLNETFFSAAEYGELRAFFEKYFDKIEEDIVLSRDE
jgi:hypothetical protein